MAAFAPSATGNQSTDGTVATFIDTSNYGTNDEGYVRTDFTTREFILRDAYGVVLSTQTIPDSGADQDKVYYDLTVDMWIEATLFLDGVAEYSTIIYLPFTRFGDIQYVKQAKNGCECGCLENCSNLMRATVFRQAAIIEALAGNGAGFQVDIDAYNSTLTCS